jgi:NitT/TauT family transport system permease protein
MTDIPLPASAAPADSAEERRRLRIARARKAKTLSIFKHVALPILTALAVLIAWELAVDFHGIPKVILPAPWDIAERIWSIRVLLYKNAISTTTEAVAGFAIATTLGVVLATALVYSSWLRAALYPNIVFFQLIPKIALAPLFIVWLGIGAESRLTFAVFISFFPVVIATITGLSNVPTDMLRLCRALTASNWQIFWAVRFPYALPHLFSGMKIAITFAIIGVVVGEFITANKGLGYLIMFASSMAETTTILASISVLCAIGLTLFGLVTLAEKIVLKAYGHKAA